MKLNKLEKVAYAEAEKILIESGLDAEKNYAFGITQESKNRKPESVMIHVTFPYRKDIVEVLKIQGWRVAKKYANHGSPNFFCSDVHNDESELQELIRHHGKRVEMVRMFIERTAKE